MITEITGLEIYWRLNLRQYMLTFSHGLQQV